MTPATAQLTASTLRTEIVIVNYRTAHCVVTALRSLADEVRAMPESHVTVVDNASPDDSYETLREAVSVAGWSSWVSVVRAEHNGGFASGNNVAIRAALAAGREPECVLLLNPDTYIRPGAVQTLADFLCQRPDVGIVGARLEEDDQTQQSSCFRFYNVWSEFNAGVRLGIVSRLLARHVTTPPMRDETHEVDWVSGAAMMIRTKVFESIGLMDDGYFLYYEEADFQLRARRAGWSVWHVHQARVVHLMGQSTGVTGRAEKLNRRPHYWFASRRRYFTENYGPLYAFAVNLAWLFGFSLWRVRRVIQRKPDLDPPCLWWDFFRYALLGLPAPRARR